MGPASPNSSAGSPQSIPSQVGKVCSNFPEQGCAEPNFPARMQRGGQIENMHVRRGTRSQTGGGGVVPAPEAWVQSSRQLVAKPAEDAQNPNHCGSPTLWSADAE